MIPAVSLVIAFFNDSRSAKGTWSNPSTFGSKPSICFGLFAANSAARVLPWKAPLKVIILFLLGWPIVWKYFLAILILASVASDPEFWKHTKSAKV
jgi:hypothetical protein